MLSPPNVLHVIWLAGKWQKRVVRPRCLSVVGCSVSIVDGGPGESIVDGGPGEQPIPQQPWQQNAVVGDENAQRVVQAAAAAQAARAGADADTLAADAFLNEALTRVAEGISDLTDTRWACRGPAVVAAAVRAIARQQARLGAAYLTLMPAVDPRDDVVPRSRAKTTKTAKATKNAGAAFLRASLGLNPGKAKRDADLARLTTSAN